MTKYFLISSVDSRSGSWEVWETFNVKEDIEDVVRTILDADYEDNQRASFKGFGPDVDSALSLANTLNQNYYGRNKELPPQTDVF